MLGQNVRHRAAVGKCASTKVFFLTPLFRLQGCCPSTPPQGHAYYPQLRYAFATCKKPASPTATSAAASDWGSLLLRRARALARGAAHPSGTGGAALAKPAPVPCWRRLAARQQPVCPTNGATSPRRPRGGELAGLFATGRGVGAARSGQPRHSAQNHELLWPSAAELRVCGPFAALGDPEHGPICFSGSRLRMPRAREG